MFHVYINMTATIEGCPACGLDAVRFREAHGLPVGASNTMSVRIDQVDRAFCEHPEVVDYLNSEADVWETGNLVARPEVLAQIASTSVHRPTELLLEFWRDLVRTRRAEYEQREVEAAELRALSDEQLGYRFIGNVYHQQFSLPTWLSSHDEALYQRARQCAQAVIDALQRAESEAKERRRTERAEREKAEAAEIAAWAAEHGSSRLRRLLAEGIDCNGVYVTERLALEYPGWRLERLVPGADVDPRNAPEAALDMLDEARQSAGERTAGAALRFWRHVDNDLVWKGYVAMIQDDHLGWLVWGGPQGVGGSQQGRRWDAPTSACWSSACTSRRAS